MGRGNAEIKMRFRRIDDWTGLRLPYICGWPNFEMADYNDGRGVVYGHYLLSDAVADWRDARFVADLGAPAEYPLRGMFTRVATWAGTLGYQHGFPNFQQAVSGGVEVRGTYLIVPGTAEFRDVPAVQLGLGNGSVDPETHQMDEWFWGAARYATSHGFVAGMPTGHRVNTSDGFVCGVWLFPQGTATWVDIPARDLGYPSGSSSQQSPPPPPPPPPPPTSGTIVVTLIREFPSTYDSGYRVATAPDPTGWRNLNARITAVRNRHSEDITLTHIDSFGARRGPVLVPKPTGPFAGPSVHNFDGMSVAGDWGADTSWNLIPPSAIPFEIDWTV